MLIILRILERLTADLQTVLYKIDWVVFVATTVKVVTYILSRG